MESTGSQLEEAERGALARLTEREKDCLRRWLRHQTAKEMAIELGVSPHAVEKRLKMARIKLGLSSSLDAARLLAASEGYQHVGPQSPDLAQPGRDDQVPAGRLWLAGGILMTLIMAAALAFALQPSGGANADSERDGQDNPATTEMIESVVRNNFTAMDQDRSGFLEPREIPVSVEGVGRAAIAAGDKDSDGKLDLAEYRGWLAPIIADRGAVGRKYVEEHFSRAND